MCRTTLFNCRAYVYSCKPRARCRTHWTARLDMTGLTGVPAFHGVHSLDLRTSTAASCGSRRIPTPSPPVQTHSVEWHMLGQSDQHPTFSHSIRSLTHYFAPTAMVCKKSVWKSSMIRCSTAVPLTVRLRFAQVMLWSVKTYGVGVLEGARKTTPGALPEPV